MNKDINELFNSLTMKEKEILLLYLLFYYR